jgi:hypothetical protein
MRHVKALVSFLTMLALTGCGNSNSVPATVSNPPQQLAAGVYFNPTNEYIAINLDGHAPLILPTDYPSKAPLPVNEMPTSIQPQPTRVVKLGTGDSITPGIGDSSQITIVGCLDPVILNPSDPSDGVTVCYDSSDLLAAAQNMRNSLMGILVSINDLIGDPGHVTIVLTNYSGSGTVYADYQSDQQLVLIQYTNDIAALMQVSHELGHAVFYRVRGDSGPGWLNEAVAMWTERNYLDFVSLDMFDGGTPYADPWGYPGYLRVYAASQLMSDLMITTPKQALTQPDFVMALTGLDEQAFARKFWKRYGQYVPQATFSQYVGPYGAIKITGTGSTVAGSGKLEQM